MTIRRRRTEAPDIGPATTAVLLAGWTAEPPIERTDDLGFTGSFLDLYETAGIARLWRTHREFLLAQAAAWGWEPSYEVDGTKLFFGEYVCRTGRES